MSILNCSMEELTAKIKRGDLLPQELKENIVKRCSRAQEEFNIFISFDAEILAKEIDTLFQDKLKRDKKLN